MLQLLAGFGLVAAVAAIALGEDAAAMVVAEFLAAAHALAGLEAHAGARLPRDVALQIVSGNLRHHLQCGDEKDGQEEWGEHLLAHLEPMLW